MTADSPSRSGMFVVDRREGRTLVIVGDDDRSVDVPVTRVPKTCRVEGAVLRVPIDDAGEPYWEDARRDRGEERRRLAALAKRIKLLGRSDPGGDIVL